jgi:long-chain acyl-CoA synthetase
VFEGYFSKETSPVLTVNSPTNLKFGSVGKTLFNVQVKIAEDGEILAKGPNIMTGYYKDEKYTELFLDLRNDFRESKLGTIRAVK